MIYLLNAFQFILQVFFGIFLFIFMLRFILVLVQADFNNPISQLLFKLTQPIIKPLSKIIPAYYSVDWATLIILFLVKMIETSIVIFIHKQQFYAISTIILSTAELLQLALTIYFFSLIALVIFSWLNPNTYNPATILIHQISNPILKRIRTLMPPYSGIDFSPMIAMFGIFLIEILLVAPLRDLSLKLL